MTSDKKLYCVSQIAEYDPTEKEEAEQFLRLWQKYYCRSITNEKCIDVQWIYGGTWNSEYEYKITLRLTMSTPNYED